MKINWNEVARSPILTQEITNGHAARMRYSRFRSSILGIKPQRRYRNTQDNSKVAKPKKGTRVKKEKESDRGTRQDETSKPETNTKPNTADNAESLSHTFIKNETVGKTETQQQPLPQAGARPLAYDLSSASIADVQLAFPGNRLLTPCSDSELFASAHGYASSPVGDLNHHEHHFHYSGSTSCPYAREPSSWQPSPSYSPFHMNAPYDLDNYTNTTHAFCDHPPSPRAEDFGIAPSAMMIREQSHVPVKHEEWDTPFP